MGDFATGFFDNQSITPIDFGRLFAKICSDGVLWGCTPSTSGDVYTITAGSMVISGRYLELSASKDIDVDEETSGYARIKVVIDLTETATSEAFAQAKWEVEYDADGVFPALTQDDINDGTNTDYEFVIAIMSLDAGGIDTVSYTALPSYFRLNPLSISPFREAVGSTSYTFALTDAGKVKYTAAAGAYTLTVPLNASVAFPTGTVIFIERAGTSTCTVAPVSGSVTINSVDSNLAIANQYGMAFLYYLGGDVWNLVGDLG